MDTTTKQNIDPKPTTVRGWLETLPEPLRGLAVKDSIECGVHAKQCPNLIWSISHLVDSFANQSAEGFFWCGVRLFCLKPIGKDYPFVAGMKIEYGYAAAKSAFENQRQIPAIVPACKTCSDTGIFENFDCPDCLHAFGRSIPINVETLKYVPQTHSFSGGPKEWKEFQKSIVPESYFVPENGVTVRNDADGRHEIKYVSVAQQDYERMHQRDVLWDEMRKEIQRLQDNLTDLLMKMV